ncbi:hypothetical protein BKA67DRAFT_536496 [Truncatella angustata]|uniref:Uncharacterized protein n=1 Tax=Truncatella angustata TaxID=152316 RepID=A0A9P8UIJ6_9PEZI|nr:uncharacterized protein BKA67DRAFT_536496 [Truncatella angustata]KAH6652776.1 hypothetical protein BKA67DRAFT_536496 [Truncatella angustata]
MGQIRRLEDLEAEHFQLLSLNVKPATELALIYFGYQRREESISNSDSESSETGQIVLKKTSLRDIQSGKVDDGLHIKNALMPSTLNMPSSIVISERKLVGVRVYPNTTAELGHKISQAGNGWVWVKGLVSRKWEHMLGSNIDEALSLHLLKPEC